MPGTEEQGAKHGGPLVGQNLLRPVGILRSEPDGAGISVVLLVGPAVQKFALVEHAMGEVEEHLVGDQAEEEVPAAELEGRQGRPDGGRAEVDKDGVHEVHGREDEHLADGCLLEGVLDQLPGGDLDGAARYFVLLEQFMSITVVKEAIHDSVHARMNECGSSGRKHPLPMIRVGKQADGSEVDRAEKKEEGSAEDRFLCII